MMSSSPVESEACLLDADGLKPYYDLVLLGTGLVQSMVSCVASKYGKTVLHLDRNNFYGEANFASHSLSSHLSFYGSLKSVIDSDRSITGHDIHDGDLYLNSTNEDIIVVEIRDNVSEFKDMASCNRSNSRYTHPACFNYVMERTTQASHVEMQHHHVEMQHHHPVFLHYLVDHRTTKARLLTKDRDFNVDSSSKPLFCSGEVVSLLINSGVSNYLEFRAYEGLFFYVQHDCRLWKVPCSRGDVFNTTMLSALEKRELMKFHSFVADWGRVCAGTEVSSFNEYELASGRSLHRPQNKVQAFKGYNLEEFEDRHIVEFLNDCRMSPKLQQIILYALCCYHSNASDEQTGIGVVYSTRTALRDMFSHIDSLGRFGDTAFLCPVYGTCEVVQAFCRMSAVWGGTFILNRSITKVQISAALSEKLNDSPIEVLESAVPSHRLGSSITIYETEGKSIQCGAFVCGASYWPGLPTSTLLQVSSISIWLGSPLPMSQSIAIIPPFSSSKQPDGRQLDLNNPYAVHITQTGPSSNASPFGSTVLHITTRIFMESTGDLTQESSWKDKANPSSKRASALIEAIVALLQCSQVVSIGDIVPEEITRVVVLKAVYDVSDSINVIRAAFSSNVEVCFDSEPPALTLKSQYTEAKRIFESLFPDLDFSLQALEKGRENFAPEEDEEASYLESALSSVQQRKDNE